MSAPFDTLYLHPTTWDVVADAAGNIALASPPYSVAQDVSSACRLFSGELYYDSSAGVQFLQKILGKTPPLNVAQGALAAAALTVPSVDSASCVVSSFQNRAAAGQVQFETEDGTSLSVPIA